MAPTPQCQCLVTATHPPLHHRTTGSYHTQRLLPTDSSMSHIKLPSPLPSTTVGFRRTAQQTGNGLAVHPLRHQRTPNLLRHPRLGIPSPLHSLGSEGASKKHVHNIPDSPTCLRDYHRRLFRLYDHAFCLHDIAAPLQHSISFLRHHRIFAHLCGILLSLRLSPLSQRHHRVFAVHPFCLHDIAAPLRHTISSLRPPPPTLSHRHRRVFSVITSSPPTTTHFVSMTLPHLCGHFIWSLRLCTVPLQSFYSVSTTPPPSQYFYFLPFGHLSYERECRIIRDRTRLP